MGAPVLLKVCSIERQGDANFTAYKVLNGICGFELSRSGHDRAAARESVDGLEAVPDVATSLC